MEAGSTPDVVEQSRLARSMEWARNNVKRIAAVGAIALAGVGVYEVGRSNGDSGAGAPNVPALEATASAASETACDTYEATNLTQNADNYLPDAFLPQTTINSSETTQEEVTGLFAQNGPVTDPATLAALMAAVVEPAQRGAVNNPNYNYAEVFTQKLSAYRAPGGQQVAEQDCKTAQGTLVQVAGYNSSWAKPGEKVSRFKALRTPEYNINGAEVTKAQVVQQTLSGTEYVLRATTKGLNGEQLQGFDSVLETPDGMLYIKGLSPNQTGKSTANKGNNPDKDKHNKGHNKGQSQQGSAGGGASENASGTFGTSNDTGESDIQGPVKETGPGSNAGNGGQTGHQPGPAPSFGGGNGNNGGGEKTPSTPTTPTTPSTPSTPSTPNTPPTTPTTPTTPEQPPATPPKGAEPTCVPNPPYVIC